MSRVSGERAEQHNRWWIVVFLAGFSVWQILDVDYWGAAFGFIFGFCVAVKPDPGTSSLLRKQAFVGGVATLLFAVVVAVYATIRAH
jgi:hypothetical protein